MKVSKETLETASSPIAIGYFHSTLFFTKNPKLGKPQTVGFSSRKKESSIQLCRCFEQVDKGTHQVI